VDELADFGESEVALPGCMARRSLRSREGAERRELNPSRDRSRLVSPDSADSKRAKLDKAQTDAFNKAVSAFSYGPQETSEQLSVP